MSIDFILSVSQADLATMLGVLRWYQRNGPIDDPADGPEWLRDIITSRDELVPLDSKGIDELCKRINPGGFSDVT